MIAPRTNADSHFTIGDECAVTMRPSSVAGYETLSVYDGDNALKVRMTPEARFTLAAALRKEPPALPAEVEAVLAKLELWVKQNDLTDGRGPLPTDVRVEAATLLRRYAQAVAEKDCAKCPCDVHACLATVAEKDAEIARLESEVDTLCCAAENRDAALSKLAVAEKKLQAVEALTSPPDEGTGGFRVSGVGKIKEI